MKTVINGIETNYQTAGQGEAVLLLHGWGSSLEPYRQLMNLLARATMRPTMITKKKRSRIMPKISLPEAASDTFMPRKTPCYKYYIKLVEYRKKYCFFRCGMV